MKTILITGHEGFTGPYISQQFTDAGYRVIGLVYQNPKEGEIACDLTDKDQVDQVVDQVKPDGVIHLAGLSFVGHEDQSAFYKVNVFSTLNLLEAVQKAKLDLRKFIVASSANIYGPSQQGTLDERVSPNPINHYAASKFAMEQMVKNWFPRIPIVITRPFNYTGVGQDPKFLIPKIVKHYREKKKLIELGNLDVARDFSDVRDVARSYFNLFESQAKSEIVNLCSGRVVQLQSIIDQMDKIAGYDIEVSVNPDFVRADEVKVLMGDDTKLRSLTGHKHGIALSQTLHDMYNA